MKKVVNLAFFYCILGLVSGVFYREYTKAIGYEGDTTLSVVHTHTLILGMFFFLIVLLVIKQFDVTGYKSFKWFIRMYSVGLPMTLVMLFVRGMMQANEVALSSGADSAISGMAGLGHMTMATGMILFFVALRKKVV